MNVYTLFVSDCVAMLLSCNHFLNFRLYLCLNFHCFAEN